MACSIPICLLIHRRMADGTEALLMAPDLATALADIADAGDFWTAERITLGSEIILEGEALEAAVSASRARAAA
jgi:hypothetical protein